MGFLDMQLPWGGAVLVSLEDSAAFVAIKGSRHGFRAWVRQAEMSIGCISITTDQ